MVTLFMLFTNFWTDWQLTRRLRNSITLLNFMLSQSLWNMNIYIIRFLQMWEVHFYTNTGHLILMLNLHSLTCYSGFLSESLDLLSAKVFYAITEPQSNIINLSPCCVLTKDLFSVPCAWSHLVWGWLITSFWSFLILAWMWCGGGPGIDTFIHAASMLMLIIRIEFN